MQGQQPLPLRERLIPDAEAIDDLALQELKDRFIYDATMTRQLVSFQASKGHPVFRWFKYKEAFSPTLVTSLLNRYAIRDGTILDPFAGSGATLFAAGMLGLPSKGIELLPVGCEVIRTRKLIEDRLDETAVAGMKQWLRERPWAGAIDSRPLNELRITRGAYPAETVDSIERYLARSEREPDVLATILRFALLCVLESVSFTRKDGQYLRWDCRADRKIGMSAFNKGPVARFDEALSHKLSQIILDVEDQAGTEGLFASQGHRRGELTLRCGSCLDLLPDEPSGHYSAVFTSPPYCNRYDYTRTYALELAVLGVKEDEIKSLRQQMLSCTVENRVKDLIGINPFWRDAATACNQDVLLQSTLSYLDQARTSKLLNNGGISRMVRGYFYEMACVIYECHRLLRTGGLMFMVNDNVRYAGLSISVDLILSRLALALGFEVERIHVLPMGKGNNSQQMGRHGRSSLRKCVYVWRKR